MSEGNINEFIYLYFLKDEEAIQLIIDYYRPLVMKLIRSKQAFSSKNDGWLEDRLALADTVLLECLHSYRIDQKASFTTFYKQVLSNRLIDEGKYDVRHQIKYHYDILPLDQHIKEDEAIRYIDAIPDPKTRNNYSLELNEILDAIENKDLFTEVEATALKLRMEGYTQGDIAKKIGKSSKAVRQIFDKFRKWYLDN